MTMISYSPPSIADHGTLVDLTADFDLHFVGSVAKVVSMAAVSPAIGGVVPGVVDPPAAGPPAPPAGPSGVLESASGLGGAESQSSPGVLGDELAGGPDVAADVGSGPGGPAGAGGVAGAGGGGSEAGGSLPFTGYYATLSAAAGATLTTAGVALRAKLRRKS